jgi:hypothetical protein
LISRQLRLPLLVQSCGSRHCSTLPLFSCRYLGNGCHATRGLDVLAHATCGPDVHDRDTRGPGVHAHATRGPGIHVGATRGPSITERVFVCATHGLGFTLRPTPPPLCTSDDIRLSSRSTPTSGRRSTTPSPWLVTPPHPPDGHPSCRRCHQARRSSTALRCHCSPDTVSGPDLCP